MKETLAIILLLVLVVVAIFYYHWNQITLEQELGALDCITIDTYKGSSYRQCTCPDGSTFNYQHFTTQTCR